MPTFNIQKHEMFIKVVYYGCGLCGKTTNLNQIFQRTSKNQSPMTSLVTEQDRTMFFDYSLVEVGTVSGFKVRLQVYTVPGQVFYNATRKLVLKNTDGVVFVVDSQAPLLDQNMESLENLRANLLEDGVNLDDLPLVFQYNKQDLPNLTPVEKLEEILNPKGLPSFTSVATTGEGVFETLREITRISLGEIRGQHFVESDTNSDILKPLDEQDLT